jgi:hypothetical protein
MALSFKDLIAFLVKLAATKAAGTAGNGTVKDYLNALVREIREHKAGSFAQSLCELRRNNATLFSGANDNPPPNLSFSSVKGSDSVPVDTKVDLYMYAYSLLLYHNLCLF